MSELFVGTKGLVISIISIIILVCVCSLVVFGLYIIINENHKHNQVAYDWYDCQAKCNCYEPHLDVRSGTFEGRKECACWNRVTEEFVCVDGVRGDVLNQWRDESLEKYKYDDQGRLIDDGEVCYQYEY